MSKYPAEQSVTAFTDKQLVNQLAVVNRLIRTWLGPYKDLVIAEAYKQELADELFRRTGLDGTEPERGYVITFPQGGVNETIRVG